MSWKLTNLYLVPVDNKVNYNDSFMKWGSAKDFQASDRPPADVAPTTSGTSRFLASADNFTKSLIRFRVLNGLFHIYFVGESP